MPNLAARYYADLRTIAELNEQLHHARIETRLRNRECIVEIKCDQARKKFHRMGPSLVLAERSASGKPGTVLQAFATGAAGGQRPFRFACGSH